MKWMSSPSISVINLMYVSSTLQEPLVGVQFPPASIVQFGRRALHPAPNGGVVSRESSFHEKFFDLPVRKRKPQIPPDRENNDLGFEVPPLEQRWTRFGIHGSLSDRSRRFCNTTVWAKRGPRLGT